MNTYNMDVSLDKVVVPNFQDASKNHKHDSMFFVTNPEGLKDVDVSTIRNSYVSYNPSKPLPTLSSSSIQNQMMMQARSGFTPVHGSNGIVQPNTLNLNLNINKNAKKEEVNSNNNKRTIAKKTIPRSDINHKFKNDGQNDGDGEGEDDEEDPDIALFNNLEKKRSSMTPSGFSKSPGLLGSQPSIIQTPASSAFEFQTLKKNNAASPASLDSNAVRMKPMREVENSIGSKSSIKFEEMKMPNTLALTKENLSKNAIKFELKGEHLKRASKQKSNSDGDLSEVTLSEQDIETSDTML